MATALYSPPVHFVRPMLGFYCLALTLRSVALFQQHTAATRTLRTSGTRFSIIMASKDDAIDLTDNDHESPSRSPIKKRVKRNSSDDVAPASKARSNSTAVPKRAAPVPAQPLTTLQTAPVAVSSVETKTPRSVKAPPFNICTYNIWFGREENAGPFAKERMNALMAAIRPHSPRLIGLQEVTPLLAMHLAPLLQSMGYQVISQDLTSGVGYGTAVAVRADVVVEGGFVPFRTSNLGRGISYAICQFDNREVLFTTTHAESWCGPDYIGAKERELQLKEMTTFCESWMTKRTQIDMAIITGDLNWDDWRPKSQGPNTALEQIVGPDWLDAWKLAHPTDPGYTYDGKTNPMLSNNLRRRFDRCLLRTNKKSFSIESAVLIGADPIPGLKWASVPSRTVAVTPSDHYGVVIKVQY